MIEESTTEARQGDRRRMNMRVLGWSLGAAVLLVGLLALLWTGNGA
jgi:hypothetical protein